MLVPSRPCRALVVSACLALGFSSANPAFADDVSVTVNGVRHAPDTPSFPVTAPREPCAEDCFVLSHLALRGAVDGTMTFELHGSVRVKEEIKIPLFGPPGQVHLSDVTIDGARATLMFDNDQYFVFTRSPSFTVRGKLALGTDAILTVPGPLVALDASLTRGKLVEGEKLSGITAAVLHFDPLLDGESAKARTPSVFRLSRALRVGRETAFVLRLVASQATEIGAIRLPLKNGEKVQDVQGADGWRVEGSELVLPTAGKEAEITVSGTMAKPTSFTPDERSAYEWLLVEADPEHRVSTAGGGKLVETSQSPIPPTMPGARVYLLQRGERIEVESRSLVRGDALAAVARSHERFVALTGAGELISDELIFYDNNGLDHLAIHPAGKAVYLSTDGAAQRILHDDQHSKDVLVPVETGRHRMRVQTLSNASVWPLAGALAIPPSTYPLATSTVDVTVGLPSDIHPLAVLGGDRVRWGLGQDDLLGVALGIALACFGFRNNKTRAVGALATAGLWFVSRDGFVVATGILGTVGLVFLASRFVRGTRLLVASGFIVAAGLLACRGVLASKASGEPTREMFVESPSLPRPETGGDAAGRASREPGDITPVSLSLPTSERYVVSSRQVVSQERPFVPRIVYVTSTFVGFLHLVWAALVALLAFVHRGPLRALKARIEARLRRPTGAAAPPPAALTTEIEAPPF